MKSHVQDNGPKAAGLQDSVPKNRAEQFTVEKSLPDKRLDQFLREQFPAASRVALKRLIEEGHIRVDGKIIIGDSLARRCQRAHPNPLARSQTGGSEAGGNPAGYFV